MTRQRVLPPAAPHSSRPDGFLPKVTRNGCDPPERLAAFSAAEPTQEPRLAMHRLRGSSVYVQAVLAAGPIPPDRAAGFGVVPHSDLDLVHGGSPEIGGGACKELLRGAEPCDLLALDLAALRWAGIDPGDPGDRGAWRLAE